MPQAAFIYTDQLSRHVLRADHPLKAIRLRMTYELLQAYGAFELPDAILSEPRPATMQELLPVHTQEYVEAVHGISDGDVSVMAERYGFSPLGDNPAFPGMYEAAMLATGASQVAAELVAAEAVPVAFNISGGLHHAAQGRASGFCVFNDPAVAIAALRQQGMQVAYVDIDAHHGDGVQDAFYDTDQVLTISLHESGQYLFPGTGEPSEIGSGAGRGYSVNVPFAPYTSDAVYHWAFEAVALQLLEKFAPDALVLQLGVDAHYRDPLSHLRLTTGLYQRALPELLSVCPRVVALGGGGYDQVAVARVWAMEYGIMLGQSWPVDLPQSFRDAYGGTSLLDEPQQEEDDVVTQTRTFAERSVEEVERLIFPFHGL